MKWSPNHYREEDKAYERSVAALFRKLGYESELSPREISRWDVRIRCHPTCRWTWVEVKRPNIDWGRREYVFKESGHRIPIKGPFVTVSKIQALLQLGPTLLVVVALDLVARYEWMTPFGTCTYVIDSSDTNQKRGVRGDPKDKNVPRYVVPFDSFSLLGPIELEL